METDNYPTRDLQYWYGALIVLFLIIIGSTIWALYEANKLVYAENTESFLCPSLYCGKLLDGTTSGSKCENDVAYRTATKTVHGYYDFDKGKTMKTITKGDLMCQGYTIPENIVQPNYDFNETPDQEANRSNR